MGIKVAARRALHGLIRLRLRRQWRRRLQGGVPVSLSPPDALIWVRPGDVQETQRLSRTEQETLPAPLNGYRFDKWAAAGLVLDGDWDRSTVPVATLSSAIAYRKLFEQGVSWEEIPEMHADIKRAERKARRHCVPWKSKQFVERRIALLAKMHETFQHQEYGLQRQLTGRSLDELAVNIGRDGRLIRNSSAEHRLVIAQLAGLEWMPARVVARHAEWETIRRRITRLAGDSDAPPELQPYLEHPDVQALRKTEPTPGTFPS